MYKIVSKKVLNPTVVQMDIEAPFVARKAKAGQFIILRVDECGERIPLTVAGKNPSAGTIRIIFQTVGATTMKLAEKSEGEFIEDFAGPLGRPTEIEGMKRVCVVGGGVGCAIALPVATALSEQGSRVTSIVGFRSRELLILEDEFKAVSDNYIIMSDDGSVGRRGLVTEPLRELLSCGEQFDAVIAIGPLIMMKFVTEVCREFSTPVIVSMNPIMIDGTGMCGGCRLTVGGKTVFACVDGPDFDGYLVDFDEAMERGSIYRDFEAGKREENCNLLGKGAE